MASIKQQNSCDCNLLIVIIHHMFHHYEEIVEEIQEAIEVTDAPIEEAAPTEAAPIEEASEAAPARKRVLRRRLRFRKYF